MVAQTRKQTSPHCQCSPTCRLPPLPNSPFCKKHLAYCPRTSPLTGEEPVYDPERYNRHRGIKESHNCYTYAVNYLHLPKGKSCTKNACPLPFPQPGRASGYPKWSEVKGKRCPDLISRIIGDIPKARRSTFEQKCPPNMRKIALVADEDEDYHFYRQDANGYWSHKPGATEVIRLDATQRPIYDPELASRDYPKNGLHYDQFCSYLCVPSRKRHRLKRGGKSVATRSGATKSAATRSLATQKKKQGGTRKLRHHRA